MPRSRSPRRRTPLSAEGFMLLDLAEPAWLAQALAQYWREAPELLPAVRKECRQLFSGRLRNTPREPSKFCKPKAI